MYKIFAVEPAAISNYKDARYILEKFGFPQGALAAVLPKNWERLVIDCCNDSPVKKKTLVEDLKKYKKQNRFMRFGFAYDPSSSWIDNARLLDGIDKVVVSEDGLRHASVDDKLLLCDRIDDATRNLRSFSPKKTAEDLAYCAKYLVASSKESVVFIDPYFSGSAGQIKVIEKILSYANNYISRNVVIHAFSESENRPKNSWAVKNIYSTCFLDLAIQGWSFDIYLWDKKDADRHPRYLITDIGCLFYDKGFNEPNDHGDREQAMVVICETEVRREEQLKYYKITDYKGEYIRVDAQGARLVAANVE